MQRDRAVSRDDLFLIDQHGDRDLADRARRLDDLTAGFGDLVIDPLLLVGILALVGARPAGSPVGQVGGDRDGPVAAAGRAGFVLRFGRDHHATLRIKGVFVDLFPVGHHIDIDLDHRIARPDPCGQQPLDILAYLGGFRIAGDVWRRIVAVRGYQASLGIDHRHVIGPQTGHRRCDQMAQRLGLRAGQRAMGGHHGDAGRGLAVVLKQPGRGLRDVDPR